MPWNPERYLRFSEPRRRLAEACLARPDGRTLFPFRRPVLVTRRAAG